MTANLWAELGNWATAAGGNILHAALIVVGAFLLSWVLRVVIRRVVKQIVSGVKKGQNVTDTQALVASPLAAVRVVQRTRTLGSVLSNIVNVTIGIVTIILVVQVFAPEVLTSFALLTAAIGAGLGFGAQNIVKDVLNGLFMVMEDQLGVGDVVDLGSATGVVEAVGIRITQVRDVNGTLWFVRNGEILRVGNMSQGWSRVIVDVAVPYETDIEAVQNKLMEAATALTTSARWRSRVLEKPELWGLESISADAMVVRIVLKTRTTAKDDVSRELRLRLKGAVDELGVKLPSLSAVVLSGFDGAGSVGGAKPPRTRPTPTIPPPPLKGRKARAAAGRGAGSVPDPGAIRIRPAAENPPGAKPATPKPADKPAVPPRGRQAPPSEPGTDHPTE
ncbi:small-conductance mechanosensitive channel [Leifsonia xyli subsp. cynodontis DSM 46306]|uniref:Mechanosensitive ion channel protein MscS n=1 Tax=Leifsonia xyli subsp. cynodontis DSM 46306 TaxID=1389489 RepID=U3PDH8_LEIXC|nr:mechanosensitive ion channel domain-containing protein [Leifsonia xyli]AGW41598.1 small-conductance mechanosensitive channel [Leifsonia xyli subsp. cynodontis DSM 46306]